MKVILLNPVFIHYASSQPPLGLAYLASVARTRGAEVRIIDAHAQRLGWNEIIEKIRVFKPDILGITITTPVFDFSIELLGEIKQLLSIPVIAGGPHPSALPEEALRTGVIDIVCKGEGEKVFVELFEYFSGKMPLGDVSGICYLDGGEFRANECRYIQDLDQLPFPDWDDFNLRDYWSPARKKNLSLPIMTSRGCPSGCYFCYKEVFGSAYRSRSPENVVAEIEYLKKRYAIEEFSVIDDNFSLVNKRAEDISNLIIERKINLPWSLTNGIRVAPLSEKMLRLMKESGCYRVFFGAETGNPDILKNINKRITIGQIEEAVRLTKKVGLETGVFFMIGNIGEDEEKINQTIKFAVDLNPDLVQFTIATPYPGTEFYEKVKTEGRFLFEKWQDIGSYEKAVFEHGALTAELVDRKFKDAYAKFYLRPSFVLKKIKGIRTVKDISNLWQGGRIFMNFTMKN